MKTWLAERSLEDDKIQEIRPTQELGQLAPELLEMATYLMNVFVLDIPMVPAERMKRYRELLLKAYGSAK